MSVKLLKDQRSPYQTQFADTGKHIWLCLFTSPVSPPRVWAPIETYFGFIYPLNMISKAEYWSVHCGSCTTVFFFANINHAFLQKCPPGSLPLRALLCFVNYWLKSPLHIAAGQPEALYLPCAISTLCTSLHTLQWRSVLLVSHPGNL